MSNKRVKRVHISGWLDVFLADTIMARIAHYLSTPTLFQLLLGVNKELRKKATTSKRWNQIMEYGTRLKRDLKIPWLYKDNQNVLVKFIKRLYGKTICSTCFQMGRVRQRPGYNGLNMCWTCGIRRKYVVSSAELVKMFLTDADTFLELPQRRLWRDELPIFVPKIYRSDDHCFDHELIHCHSTNMVRCRNLQGKYKTAYVPF